MLNLLFSGAVAGEPCERVGLADVLDVGAPAIIVLGERRGTQPDLWRAQRVVRGLAARDEVTLALQAVDVSAQGVLDQVPAGTATASDIRGLIAWDDHWPFPYWPYKPLLAGGRRGVHLVAAGVDPVARPAGQQAPIPPGYALVLVGAMREHPVPVDLEGGFAQTVAWNDFRIAANSVAGWNGRGYLVIVADLFHVEGGRGIAWQAERLATAPVHSFVLSGAELACLPGDRVWR